MSCMFCCLLLAPSLQITDEERMELLCERRTTPDENPVKGIRKRRRVPLHKDRSQTSCPHLSQRREQTHPHPETSDVITTNVSFARTSCKTADKAVNTIMHSVHFDSNEEESWSHEKAKEAKAEGTVPTFQQAVNRIDNEKHSTQPQRRGAELIKDPSGSSPRPSTPPENSQTTEGTSETRAPKRTPEIASTTSQSPHSSVIQRLSGSHSDIGSKRRKICRSTVTEESMEESEQEGVWVCSKQTTSTYLVEGSAAEFLQRDLMMPSTSTSYSGEFGGSHETRIVPVGSQQAVLENSKYKCKSCIIDSHEKK